MGSVAQAVYLRNHPSTTDCRCQRICLVERALGPLGAYGAFGGETRVSIPKYPYQELLLGGRRQGESIQVAIHEFDCRLIRFTDCLVSLPSRSTFILSKGDVGVANADWTYSWNDKVNYHKKSE